MLEEKNKHKARRPRGAVKQQRVIRRQKDGSSVSALSERPGSRGRPEVRKVHGIETRQKGNLNNLFHSFMY